MPYIILSVIAILLFITLVDKKRLKSFIPGNLLASEIGFGLDVLFSVTYKVYAYTDPILNNGWCVLLMEILISPIFGVIFMNYINKFEKWVYAYILIWVFALLSLEMLFVYTGELTFYKWNFVYSFFVYLLTLILLYKSYNTYKN